VNIIIDEKNFWTVLLFKYLVTVLAVIGFYTCVTDQSMGKKALALLVNLGEEIKRDKSPKDDEIV